MQVTVKQLRQLWDTAVDDTGIRDCEMCKGMLLFRIPRTEIAAIHAKHMDRDFEAALGEAGIVKPPVVFCPECTCGLDPLSGDETHATLCPKRLPF